MYSTLQGLADLNQVLLQKILNGGGDEDDEAVKKMFALYKSCEDTDIIDERGAEPLLSVIEETGLHIDNDE